MIRDSFEQQSFENIIHFNEEELKRIINGENATHIISRCLRIRLINHGVLTLVPEMRGRRIHVTAEAQRILFPEGAPVSACSASSAHGHSGAE